MKSKKNVIVIASIAVVILIGILCLVGQKMFAANDTELAKQAQEELVANKPKEAEAHARQSLALNHNNRVAMLTLAQAFYDSKQYDQAILLCKSLIGSKTLNDDMQLVQKLLYISGESSEALGKEDDALDAYVATTTIMPPVPKYFDAFGKMCLRLKENKEAVKAFKTEIELEPNVAEHYAYYGRALSADGQTQAGVDEIRKALKMEPNNWDFQGFYAAALSKNGQSSEAIAVTKKMTTKSSAPNMVPSGTTPSSMTPTSSTTHTTGDSASRYLLAVSAFIDTKNYAMAIESATKGIAAAPNTADLFRLRADAEAKLKRFSEATDDYREAVRLNPNDLEAKTRGTEARAALMRGDK